MTKKEFAEQLRGRLKGISEKERTERTEFYCEMIDDIIESGKTEDEAVAEIGSVDDVVNQISEETPLLGLIKEKVTPKRSFKWWERVLTVLGFPVWFPLVVTVFVLAFTAFLLVWVGVIVVATVEIALVASALFGTVSFVIGLVGGEPNLISIGFGLIGVGLSLPLYYLCVWVIKLTVRLTKYIVLKIKTLFIRGV